MSTIGEKVQHIPSALASCAAILADLSINGIFHDEAKASGIGNTVWYPWITSIPKIKGILSLVFSTAIF
jgi:hypothetical protein